jgi:origin recognition complex subunit 3
VLVMGVATTADFLQGCLPSHALARLNARRFDLKTPLERLEAVVKAVLVESFSAFEIGHGVAQFITHFFLRHDLTISSFIRSLKVVCMEHFCNEPLSFLSEQLLKCRSQVELENQCATLPTELLQLAEGLPSVKRHFGRSGAEEEDGNVCISKHVAARLWALREQKQLWSMALLCVYEVGRHAGLRFLDLFCEALHTTLSSSSEIEKVPAESFLSSNLPQRMTSCGSSRGWQELKLKIREMSVPILRSLLEEWKKITSNATKVFASV